MADTKDVYIKDEGNFATLAFQTEKSIKLVKAQVQEKNLRIGKDFYGNELVKMDVDVQSIPQVENWLVSHDLSWESDL